MPLTHSFYAQNNNNTIAYTNPLYVDMIRDAYLSGSSLITKGWHSPREVSIQHIINMEGRNRYCYARIRGETHEKAVSRVLKLCDVSWLWPNDITEYKLKEWGKTHAS